MAKNKMPDGRYRSRIYLGRDENGKAKYKAVTARSLSALKEKEAEVRHQLGKRLGLLAGLALTAGYLALMRKRFRNLAALDGEPAAAQAEAEDAPPAEPD